MWGLGESGLGKVPHLAGSAVGYTGAAVASQVEVGGAGTPMAAPRRQQAQVAAVPVIDLAWVVGHCGKRKEEAWSLLTEQREGSWLWFLAHGQHCLVRRELRPEMGWDFLMTPLCLLQACTMPCSLHPDIYALMH